MTLIEILTEGFDKQQQIKLLLTSFLRSSTVVPSDAVTVRVHTPIQVHYLGSSQRI